MDVCCCLASPRRARPCLALPRLPCLVLALPRHAAPRHAPPALPALPPLHAVPGHPVPRLRFGLEARPSFTRRVRPERESRSRGAGLLSWVKRTKEFAGCQAFFLDKVRIFYRMTP